MTKTVAEASMQDACHYYDVRVFVRAPDGAVYAYAWDTCRDLVEVVEEIICAADVVRCEGEADWLFTDTWYFPSWIAEGIKKETVLSDE